MRGTDGVRRILMTADTVGGVWTYAMELARGLAVHNIQIALATMGNALSRAQAHEAAQLSNVEIYESTYRLEWMADPWMDVARAGEWLLDLKAKRAPDVIHLNGYAHGSLPWRAPVVIVGHSCVRSWWRAVKGSPAPQQQWARYRSAVTRGIRSAAAVIAPSRAMLWELEFEYGPLAHSMVIPNGRCGLLYCPGSKEQIILSAGRLWDEAKNIAALAKAGSGLEWEVTITGEATHPDGTHPSFEGVTALGVLSSAEMAKWYLRAAIYCLPARYEPFGLSVLEAALSGCALVLGDIASLRENWDDCAVFVSPDDSAELHHQLRALIRDRDRRHALAKRARARAQDFTIERMTQSYLTAYSHIHAGSTHLAAARD